MTWPADPNFTSLAKTALDAGTDSPASARAQIEALLDRVNALQALVETIIENGQPLTRGGSEAATAFVNAAAGIKVGNVASAGTDVLDWFEEGTFTPSLEFASGSVGMTYVWRYGRFMRIGCRVFYDLAFHLSSPGTSTGNAQIVGLPYAPFIGDSSNAMGELGGLSNYIMLTGVQTGQLLTLVRAGASSTTRLWLMEKTTSAGFPPQSLSHVHFPAGGTLLRASGGYFVG